MSAIADAVLRLALSLWVGGGVLFTFVLTPILFRNLGRDEAGRIVGLLFPAYFPWNLVLSTVALGAFLTLARGAWRAPHWAAVVLLVGAVAVNGYVQFGLHPQARAVKAEIHSFETVPEDHPLRRRFARLHGVSAALNLLVLADGVALLLLAPRLRP